MDIENNEVAYALYPEGQLDEGQPEGRFSEGKRVSSEEFNREIDLQVEMLREMDLVNAQKEPPTPFAIWSYGFEAEDLLAVYAALRTYMRALTGQDEEDLEMMERIVKLLKQIKPGVVHASKLLALKATSI